MERIAVVPAAGRASRLPPLPCSKELFPVGFRSGEGDVPQPKPVCLYLLERLAAAGVRKAYVAIAPHKWDVPAFLGDGTDVGLDLAYLVVRDSRGPADTVARAAPFLGDALVLLGFPDIIFEPANAFEKLVARQADTGADAVVGLFPADRPEKVDMVDVDPDGRVRRVEIKPEGTALQLTWLIGVWTPAFTTALREHVRSSAADAAQELHVGTIINAALAHGLHVDSVTFPAPACYRDVGTPEDLVAAVQLMGQAGAP